MRQAQSKQIHPRWSKVRSRWAKYWKSCLIQRRNAFFCTLHEKCYFCGVLSCCLCSHLRVQLGCHFKNNCLCRQQENTLDFGTIVNNRHTHTVVSCMPSTSSRTLLRLLHASSSFLRGPSGMWMLMRSCSEHNSNASRSICSRWKMERKSLSPWDARNTSKGAEDGWSSSSSSSKPRSPSSHGKSYSMPPHKNNHHNYHKALFQM